LWRSLRLLKLKALLTQVKYMIYGLVNADTLELQYIGQTIRPNIRRNAHLRKYPNLRMVVLERDPISNDKGERQWIKNAKTLGALLMNKTNGGNGSFGPMSDETKAKMSALLIGNKRNLNHTHSAEHKAKISAALMGNKNSLNYVPSPELRANRSAIMIGNTINVGRKRSKATRAKVSAALKGRVKSEETRAKLKATWTLSRKATHVKRITGNHYRRNASHGA